MPPAAAALGCVVLLVEDDRVSREALAGILRVKKFQVEAAASLGEALDSLDAGLPDAILLDLMLPDGTGLDVLRRVKAAGKAAVPVAVISGSAEQMIDQAVALGADHVFRKPLSATKVLAWLEQA
ncbi:MAG TPA: response regulator [Tepidisphaeraceae bacterium]|nr:response regulator [Tepidisphaeraceae bacterium]